MCENPLIKEAASLQAQIVRWRRELHARPEVGTTLPKTMTFIRQQLEDMGIPYQSYDEISCITATIGSGGKCFLLRSDADGLPVREETDVCTAAATICTPQSCWERQSS